MTNPRLAPMAVILTFAAATAYFLFLLAVPLPVLKQAYGVPPTLAWFLVGFALFIPLFAYALQKARAEGNSGVRVILLALDVKALSRKDWGYALAGFCLVLAATALILLTSRWLSIHCGTKPLSTTPWFIEMRPLGEHERWLLGVWLPMFFFNILGEELLWRGYLQRRLDLRHGWVLCSVLWLIFHIPFGIDLMIILTPVILVIPYVYQKTHNTLATALIHALLNGPAFVAVSLGWIG